MADFHIFQSEVVGIFDLDKTTVSKDTRTFLSRCESAGRVTNLCGGELPRFFVLTTDNRVILSPIRPKAVLQIDADLGYIID
jgi:hypothetical protein